MNELDKLTGGVPVVERKLTPVVGAENFCTSTLGSKKPTIMTGAIQVSAAIAPSTKTSLDFAFDNVHPNLAQGFNAFTETEVSTGLQQRPYHSEYVQPMVHMSYY